MKAWVSVCGEFKKKRLEATTAAENSLGKDQANENLRKLNSGNLFCTEPFGPTDNRKNANAEQC